MNEAPRNGTYLRFRVGDCGLALQIAAVDEVIRLGELTDLGRHIPGVDGAISLHGSVVPVAFLSRLLQIESGEPGMAVVAMGGGYPVALGVDEVLGLYDHPEQLEETSPIPGLAGQGVREIHRVGSDIVSWLDIDGIFDEESWEAIRSLSEMGTDGLLGDTTLGILGY